LDALDWTYLVGTIKYDRNQCARETEKAAGGAFLSVAAPPAHLNSIAYGMDRRKRENRSSRPQTVLACFNPASYDAA
jgi:hypothetical protein